MPVNAMGVAAGGKEKLLTAKNAKNRREGRKNRRTTFNAAMSRYCVSSYATPYSLAPPSLAVPYKLPDESRMTP